MKYKNLKKYIITYTENNNIEDWLEVIDETLLLTKNTNNVDYNPWKRFTVLSKEETIDVIKWIELDFENTIKQITSKYSKEEREGWDLQLKEAEKVINWWQSEVMSCLANSSNMTDLEYANLIKTKSEEYAIVYSNALATKRKKLSEII